MKGFEFQMLAKELSRRGEVKFAYIFGSYAKASTCSLSDIDIAVYVDEKIKEDRVFNLRLELIARVSKLLKREDIDLIILNGSDISLAFEVIYYGKLIFSRDELQRIRFEARVMSLYFDRKYYYDRHARLLIEHIAKEGIL
ncbi:MAG: nucleotidyltransferase domain-containing protein [Candidatus Aminicenantales bacterium]